MKKTLALAVVFAAVPFAAPAAEISHTYVEAGVTRYDADAPDSVGGDMEFDGAFIRGSAALSDSFYAFGGYTRATHDDFGFDLDVEEAEVGLGYNMPVGQRAELIAELGYVRQELDQFDYDGGRASAGIRGQLADRVEGWAKASYTDGDFSDGSFSTDVGALVKLNATWGLVGEIEFSEDANRYSAGIRASF